MSQHGRRRTSRPVVTTAAVAVLLFALAASAQAVHWPNFGGDAGRSGYQPVQEIAAPFGLRYSLTDAARRNVRTSIITSTGAGSAADALAIFGTQDGVLHQRALSTGTARGPEGGVAVTTAPADPDVFGAGDASVTPVETSSAGAQGQTFAVHNDDGQRDASNRRGDISIAQVDQATGLKVKDYVVPGTEGYTISSSPVISQPVDITPNVPNDPDTDVDDALLLFTATDRPLLPIQEARPRLFLVEIRDAATVDAQMRLRTPRDIAGLNVDASPALLFSGRTMMDADPIQAVAVSTADRIRFFRANDLAMLTVAQRTTEPLGGEPQTPSVPVTPSGRTPGENPMDFPRAPAIYVATANGTSTVVHKLVEVETGPGEVQFQEAPNSPSPALPGTPAPALAVTQESESGGPSAGRVIVTTSANAYSLDTENLAAGGPPQFAPSSQSGAMGFSRTTAAASGELAFLTRDDGEQLVLDADTMNRVPPGDFTEAPGNTGSTAAFGQPSLSRGFVQFASNEGLFVFRSQPRVTVSDPTVIEGDEGTRPATFTVSLSRASDETVTVAFATADRTATAGVDYVARSGTLTFSPGVTTQTVDVEVIGDTNLEPNETFALELSDAVNASPPAGPGIATILDDDREEPPGDEPAPSIDDVAVIEGDSATAGSQQGPGSAQPGTGGSQQGPAAGASAAKFPAKIRVLRAGVRAGRLDVLAEITNRANGDDVRVSFRTRGRTIRFTREVTDGRIRFTRALAPTQRGATTGILELDYAGNERVRPEDVRLRAANARAALRRGTLRVADGRLTANGRISTRARGVVRLIMGFNRPDGSAGEFRVNARIDDGRWSVSRALPPEARRGGQMSIQFTGYLPRRMRGEQLAKEVLAE